MNLKASIAAALLGLVAGVGCSATETPAPKGAGGVMETTQTSVATATTAPTATTTATVSFTSCADAAAAGYHDMKRGEPGYSTRLDRDNDGLACDTKS